MMTLAQESKVTGAAPPDRALVADTPESEVPAEVPHFKCFQHIRNPKARRAKEYEQHLLFAADRFPEFRARIETELDWARSQGERQSSSDRDRVLHTLELGEVTRREVAEDLEMPLATAYKILRELLDNGLAIARERPGIAGNRPYLVYSRAR